MNESAVEFSTDSRVHLGLATQDLKRAIGFYRLLFDQEPTKQRPDYAKFEVAQPPVNLSLNQVAGNTAPSNPVTHFGIQVKSAAAVQQMTERLKAAGAPVRVEDEVTCCYAVQKKVWTTDPDGNKWEVYMVLDESASNYASDAPEAAGCCEPAAQSQVAAPHRVAQCC